MPYCRCVLSFENRLKVRLKSVAVFSDDLGLSESGLKVRPKEKRSSENLISKFSDDLQFKQYLFVGFITFDSEEDDVEIAHG